MDKQMLCNTLMEQLIQQVHLELLLLQPMVEMKKLLINLTKNYLKSILLNQKVAEKPGLIKSARNQSLISADDTFSK